MIGEFKLKRLGRLAALAFFALIALSCNNSPSSDGVKVSEAEWKAAFDKLINRGASSEENDYKPLMRYPLFNLVGKDGDDSDENSDESEPVTLSADSGFVLRSVIWDEKREKSVDVEHIVTPEWSVFHTKDGKAFVLAEPQKKENGELIRSAIFLAGEQVDYKVGDEFYFDVTEVVLDKDGYAKEGSEKWYERVWLKAGEGKSIYERLSALLPTLRRGFDSKSIKEDKDGSFTATVTVPGGNDNDSYDIECVFKDVDGEILVTEIKSKKESLFGYTSYMLISYINKESKEREYTIVNAGFKIPDASTIATE